MEEGAAAVEAWYLLQELTYVNPIPYALKAVLQLRIPDILSEAGTPGLTAAQITAHLPRKSHDATQKLERVLRLLAHKGFFTTTTTTDSECSYGLTTLSKYFITDSEFDLHSYARLFHQTHELESSLKYLTDTIELEGANGFAMANGADLWTYTNGNPEYSEVFHAAMRSGSKLQYAILARCYDGFRDVKCLVDVGGGLGGCLGEIVAVNPHIRGKNFDLAHVVAAAPEIHGVEHVAGNFLKSVPSGDAILIQQTLHNWVDKDCITILKNCHKALPVNGKVIIRDYVIDPCRSSAAKTTAALHSDLLMLGANLGRERTTRDWEHLLQEAGFPPPSFLNLRGFDVIEAVKTENSNLGTPGCP